MTFQDPISRYVSLIVIAESFNFATEDLVKVFRGTVPTTARATAIVPTCKPEQGYLLIVAPIMIQPAWLYVPARLVMQD